MLDELFDLPTQKVVHVFEEEVKGKPVTLFDYLSDITINKRGNVTDRDTEMKVWNSFMIIRFLGMDEGYLPIINSISVYQDALSKRDMYGLLLKIIPRSRKFLKYPKLLETGIDKEHVDLISLYFKCSKAESTEFLKLGLITRSDVEKIRIAFGGKK